MNDDSEFETRLRHMAASISVPSPSDHRLQAILIARRARASVADLRGTSRLRRPAVVFLGLALAASLGGILISGIATRRGELEPVSGFVTLWPELLLAQAPDVTSLPDSETILTLDGSAIRPGLWVYRRRPVGGPPGRPEWVDSVAIREATREDEPVWTVSWTRGPFHREQADQAETLTVRKADLWPLNRSYRFGGRRAVSQVFALDSSVRISDDQGQTRVVSVPGFSPAGGAVVSGWGATRYLFQVLPLHRNWRGNIRVIGISVDGRAIDFRLPLRIIGEAVVAVPAGTFDCWAVAIGSARPSFVYWVSKAEGWVVKEALGPPEEVGPDVVGSERVLTAVERWGESEARQ